jgi:hypothetical protein
LELGRAARAVRRALLRDSGVDERLSLTQRDVAVPVVEVAGEGDGDALRDAKGSVVANADADVSRVEGEAVGPGEARCRKCGARREDERWR